MHDNDDYYNSQRFYYTFNGTWSKEAVHMWAGPEAPLVCHIYISAIGIWVFVSKQLCDSDVLDLYVLGAI